MHPSLIKLVEPLRKVEGHIWPRLKTTSSIRGVEVIRWGRNLSKPCKNITGLRPKDFRDRFATQLREHDFNQVNIERLWVIQLWTPTALMAVVIGTNTSR